MEEDSKLENILRNGSVGLGIVLLLGSIYLSFDGFDQSVSGGNSEYTILATAIGIALALAVTMLEFIISSRLEGLNTTLKILGVVAYVYSIYTNYLGAANLLHMDRMMAAIVAVFMDVVPEPLIAWGLGEAVMHDLFGNLGKIATSSHSGKRKGGGGGNNQNKGNNNNQNRHADQPFGDRRNQGGQGNRGGQGGQSHRIEGGREAYIAQLREIQGGNERKNGHG